MYCGCLMMLVCFISHVIQHCNVFSPWILKYSPWALTACWWVWDCSASPPPSCLPDLHQAGSFGRWFETNVFRREASSKPGVCLTEPYCCAQQHHRIFWAGRDHKDHGVQFLSTANLQILERSQILGSWEIPKQVCPELQLNVFSQLCTPPALGLICAKPCHKMCAIKSKSMLAAWSPWGLTKPPLWCPKLGPWWWQWATCWGISPLPKGSYTTLQDEPTHSS